MFKDAIDQIKDDDYVEKLEQQNKHYREALEFYAKRGHYIASGYPNTELQAIEFGETARKALETDNGDN